MAYHSLIPPPPEGSN